MNSDTIVDALKQQGTASDQSIQLVNPGGNNPTLFSWPAGFQFNAGAPVVLEVPTVSANAVEMSAQAGEGDSQGIWTADGHLFTVRVVGSVQPNNFGKTLKLYLFTGNGLPDSAAGAVGDKLLGQGSAVLPVASSKAAFANWYIQATCLWESASLYMNGYFSGQIAGTLLPLTAFSIYNPSNWLAQQAAGAYLPIPFVVGANIGSSAAAGNDLVNLVEFSADRV